MNFIITGVVFFIVYFLDQLTKYLTELYVTSEGINLIPGFLTIQKQYNPGMAWSFLDEGAGIILLTVVSFVATIVLGYFVLKNDWKKKTLRSFAFTFALAGCVGNLFDRFLTILYRYFNINLRQGVVDMIHFEFGSTTFNVADFFLVTGLCLLVLEIIIDYFKSNKVEDKVYDRN